MKRREFLTNAALIGTGAAAGVPAILTSCSKSGSRKIFTPQELGMYTFSDSAPDGKPLKAALIGCGDRGTGAATQFLSAGKYLQITAMADILPDRINASHAVLNKHFNTNVPEEKRFIGFDSYKKALDLADIDVVLLTTPTHFRPEHFRAAVDAGKHVFMEKPCAVDPAGIRTVIAAAKAAKSKGLTVITGNQRRHSRAYWEAYVQVRNGAIGEILSGSAHWDQGAWWNKYPRKEWSDMEYCIRNWFNIKWLSGDHILDQAIHNIDVVTWFMGIKPVSASGFGGRARRLTGDIYDFFSVDYYYENGRKMLCTARQIDGTEYNVSEQVYGTKGFFTTKDGIHLEDYDGNTIWKFGEDQKTSAQKTGEKSQSETKPLEKDHYQQEHIHLVESIRQNTGINQAEDLAYSTLVAILGREAAYTGKSITWEEIMSSSLRYGPETYEFGKLADYHEGVPPIPGKAPGQ
ncbi:MAG: Gfo/Idh/MocA family oxidoreductase [Dysgonamonadaceae bacterium]|jgi:predicted dehydrogenase|nr:Gfo/Idh/MocA family oxidoreductase [Dysgonamonadaceae bacterium]